MGKVNDYVTFMENIARDDSHGYSQNNRDGNPDYDCSSLTIAALRKAGFPMKGASYTGNMDQALKSDGFRNVINEVNQNTGAGMKRGDILRKPGHVAVYCGNGKEVEAASDEYGGIEGRNPGDQTGREILIQPYHSGWTGIWRYEGDDPEPERWFYLGLEVRQIEQGDEGKDVYTWQLLLRGAGYRDDEGKLIVRDGKFGPRTKQATIKFQTKKGLNPDGIAGKQSWNAMTGLKIKYEEIR